MHVHYKSYEMNLFVIFLTALFFFSKFSFSQVLYNPNHSSINQPTKTTRVEVLFQIRNDLNLPPMGLLAILENSDAITRASNDLGFTHGVNMEASMIEISKSTEKRWQIIAISDLFEMPADPSKSYNSPKGESLEVHFTERDVFQLKRMIRDIDTGMMISGGVGIMILNSEHISIGATGQQKYFHTLNSQINDSQGNYIYIPDGKGVRVTGIMNFAIGMADALIHSGEFTFKASLIEETRFKTYKAKFSQVLYADVSVEHKFLKGRLQLRTGAQVYFHSQGTQYTPSAMLTYSRKKWAIDSIIYFPLGRLQNDVNYNLDPEPFSGLGIRYFFTKKNTE